MTSFGGPKTEVTFSTLKLYFCSYQHGQLEAHKPRYHGTFRRLSVGDGYSCLGPFCFEGFGLYDRLHDPKYYHLINSRICDSTLLVVTHIGLQMVEPGSLFQMLRQGGSHLFIAITSHQCPPLNFHITLPISIEYTQSSVFEEQVKSGTVSHISISREFFAQSQSILLNNWKLSVNRRLITQIGKPVAHILD